MIVDGKYYHTYIYNTYLLFFFQSKRQYHKEKVLGNICDIG